MSAKRVLPFAPSSGGYHDVTAYGGVSSSAHPWATAAGVQALLRGGNAVDAAVATGFALAVVEPSMSNLGGQGNAIIHMASEPEPMALDYYAAAPGAAATGMYRWIPGPTQGAYRFYTEGDLNTTGPTSVAIPGNVAGWLYAHRRWGTLPLEQLLAPAIHYAEAGMPLTPRVAGHVAMSRDRLARFESTRKIWLHADGSPRDAGEVVVQKDLANTLRLIAQEGADSFYTGELARDIVYCVQQGGGLLTLDDLACYPDELFLVERPQSIRYRGYDVFATPVSSSTVLLPILGLLDGFEFGAYAPLDGEKLHLLAEAMKRAFADRVVHTGDPQFVNVPVQGLLSTAYASERRRSILRDSTSSPGAGDPWQFQSQRPDRSKWTAHTPMSEDQDGHTTHHSHVDRWGNFVSMTQSLGDAFGSAVVVPGRGFFLNNAMKLFDPRPDRANSIQGHKRPATAPCPALVARDGTPIMALGSPSGTRIINAIAQVLVHTLDHGLSLQHAVCLPRIHWSGDEFEIERDLPDEARQTLRRVGHQLEEHEPLSPWFGAVQVVARDPETGLCQGAADPRRQGAAAGASVADEVWSGSNVSKADEY